MIAMWTMLLEMAASPYYTVMYLQSLFLQTAQLYKILRLLHFVLFKASLSVLFPLHFPVHYVFTSYLLESSACLFNIVID